MTDSGILLTIPPCCHPFSALSGDDAVNIIDLYYASRPETPSDLSSDSTALATAKVVDNLKISSTDNVSAEEIHKSNCKIISRDEKCSTSGPGTAGQTDELKHTQKDVSSPCVTISQHVDRNRRLRIHRRLRWTYLKILLTVRTKNCTSDDGVFGSTRAGQFAKNSTYLQPQPRSN